MKLTRTWKQGINWTIRPKRDMSTGAWGGGDATVICDECDGDITIENLEVMDGCAHASRVEEDNLVLEVWE